MEFEEQSKGLSLTSAILSKRLWLTRGSQTSYKVSKVSFYTTEEFNETWHRKTKGVWSIINRQESC
jgi:hypothetical protein